jgi:hypothetical protein
MQPIPRVGDTRDIAEAALWLGSDSSTFVTGTAIPVDGGLTLYRAGGGSAAQQLSNVQLAAGMTKSIGVPRPEFGEVTLAARSLVWRMRGQLITVACKNP